MIFASGTPGVSVHSMEAQVEQKKLVAGLPLAVSVSMKVLGTPLTRVKVESGTTTLVLKSEPVVFLHVLQWQMA